MRKVIVTKYLPATSTLPARISVKSPDLPAMILPWNDDVHPDAAHAEAAKFYQNHYNWDGEFIQGWLGNQKGIVHVFPDNTKILISKLEYDLLLLNNAEK